MQARTGARANGHRRGSLLCIFHNEIAQHAEPFWDRALLCLSVEMNMRGCGERCGRAPRRLALKREKDRGPRYCAALLPLSVSFALGHGCVFDLFFPLFRLGLSIDWPRSPSCRSEIISGIAGSFVNALCTVKLITRWEGTRVSIRKYL